MTYDPVQIIAAAIATVTDRETGKKMIGRATTKKAEEVVRALEAAGWRLQAPNFGPVASRP